MGVYGFRERSNEDYVTSNYDAFYALYHRVDVTYGELADEINIDNFMNAFITECYGSNGDYPNNNVSIWKDTANHSKWNWILKDLDAIRNHTASWNMFKYMLGTNDSLGKVKTKK